MKQKHTDHSRLSNLPLKMLFFSYFNNHQSIQLMSDCHNAINDKITKLSQMINENFEEISAIVGDQTDIQAKHKTKQLHKMMQVIEEQDYWATERSNSEQQSLTQRNRNLLIKKFNNMINMLERSSDKFGEIMFMYKNEIKEIAMDLTKEREVNGKLMREVEQKSIKNKDLVREGKVSSIAEGKGKKTTTIVPMVSKSTSLKKPSFSTKPLTIPKQVEQQYQAQQQARPPPKPFCQQCLSRQKQQKQRQKLQAQQKNKWRQLSTKITNLKNQLSRYEQQLMGNQVEISRLNQQLRKKSEDYEKNQTQEKRKIKTINTTLRGEKIVLQNQVQSLKKRLQQLNQHTTSLQSQNKKLLIQKDNLQSTIKWHTNTIEDLRNNFSSGIKQQGQLLTKYNSVKQENLVLIQQIASQERYLEGFVENLKTVEESFRKQIQELNGRIRELEDIIEQKNQTIIRLKLGKHQGTQNKPINDTISSLSQTNKQLNLSHQNNRLPTKQSIAFKRDTHISGTIMNKTMKRDPLITGYNSGMNENFQDNMIKVLNKKLAIKECEIEKLKNDNEVLRAELEVYKEMG